MRLFLSSFRLHRFTYRFTFCLCFFRGLDCLLVRQLPYTRQASLNTCPSVGFHEMSHALAGVLTGARIKSIELDPDEGGATRMSGTSSFIWPTQRLVCLSVRLTGGIAVRLVAYMLDNLADDMHVS